MAGEGPGRRRVGPDASCEAPEEGRAEGPCARGQGRGRGLWDWEALGGRAGLGPGVAPGRRGVVSVGHWMFSPSGRCLRVADMTAPGQGPLAPLLETLEDPAAPSGEQTDAYLALTR